MSGSRAGWLRLILSLVIALTVVFAFGGCGNSGEKASPDQESAVSQETGAGQNSAAGQENGEGQETGAGDESSAGSGSDESAQEFPDEGQADSEEAAPERDGSYDSRDEVARYIYTYDRLPGNYITKKEARKLGWDGGSLEPYAPGKCIGGDRFGNYEGNLPDGDYRECDIDTLGKSSRGARRLVFSDEEIYYTDDHYRSFTLLYDKDGKR